MSKAISISSFLRINLFWKILIWFWLSMAVIVTTNLFIGHLSSEKTHFRTLPAEAKKELAHLKKKIVRIIFHAKDKGKLSSKRLNNVYLIDSKQREYFNRIIAEPLADLHQKVLRKNRPLSVFYKRQAFLGGIKINIDEQDYYLYYKRLDSPLSRHFIGGFFNDVARGLLFSIFIISFPISFILSWFITKPIRHLQQATHDIKAGLSNRESLNKLLSRSDEFGDLARDFDNMAHHLHATLKSQKQLLSDVSHELRSPLSRLKIALGMAEQKQVKNLEQDLARIKLESNRMNDMLDNLLTISKLESMEFSSDKEEIDLCQLFQIVVNDGQFEASESNINIITQLTTNCTFWGNKETLMSGIENILRNAIKYAGINGEINCLLEKFDEQIVLSITDTGPGVEQEQLDKLFDAFYRPELDRARNNGGVGLGLAIAKRAFAINGGEIYAENIQPHGLRVSVKFE